jgi:hypothetical protein
MGPITRHRISKQALAAIFPKAATPLSFPFQKLGQSMGTIMFGREADHGGARGFHYPC